MSVLSPGRAPRTDGEWAVEVNQRLRALESPKALRVGPWTLVTDPISGALKAMRPGQTVLIDGEGATETIAARSVDLSGLVTTDQLSSALEGIEPGTGLPTDIDSVFSALYQALTGVLQPENALSALANFFKIELGAPITSDRLPLIPLSHIRDVNPNLLVDGSFDDERTLLGFPDWDYDEADGKSRPGSAYTVADGTTHVLHSNRIEASDQDTFDVEVFSKWIGLTTAGGASTNPVQVAIAAYRADHVLINNAPAVIDSKGGAGGTSAGWVGGVVETGWHPPPLTAYIVLELTVTATATAGVVKYDDTVVRKTGTLPQNYITGLTSALSSIWSGIQARIDDWMDLLDVFGGFGVGTGNGQLTDVANRIKWLNPLDGFFNAGKLANQDQIVLPNGLSQVPTLGQLVDGATNALSGASQTGTEIIGAGVAIAKDTMENLFEMLTANTRKVQALEAQQTANVLGGRQFSINFADYPNGAFPAGLFNLTYSGAGNGSLIINGGKAQWSVGNGGYRRATMQFPLQTLTSFQVVRGTMSSPPEQGTNVRIWSVGRANAAMTDYVFARGYCTGLLTYRGDIGCVRGGVEYIWASNVPLTWSLDLRVIMGVGTNPRRHMVLSGDTIVWDGLEPSNPAQQSVLDADHLYWGAVSETNGGKVPGNVAGASVVDNAPPALVGTTFRASKRTGGDMTINSGQQPVPNNFYETVDYISPDLTYRPGSNCELECTKQGTYIVMWRCYHGNFATGSGGVGLLWKKPAGGVWAPQSRSVWGTNPINVGFGVMADSTDATCGMAMIPMNPGDVLRPGFVFTANMANTGDNVKLADGSQAWFSVTRVGT